MVSELVEDNEINELANQIALLESHLIRTRPVKGSNTPLAARSSNRSQGADTGSGRVEPPKPNVVWR